MMNSKRQPASARRHQRGVATLLVALVILVILTIIILSSSSIALFEQKTATNENRQRLVDQAAEYALNLGGEYMKANIVNLASAEVDGWLAGATKKWAKCADVGSMAADHPCMAEPDPARRANMYFYTQNGAVDGTQTLPFDTGIPAGAGITPMGGTFTATSEVRAVLCRLDTTIKVSGNPKPDCRLDPNAKSANRIAITLVSAAAIASENAKAEMKETWANFDTFSTAAAAPLVASGAVDGTGNVEIVTSPNGGGTGVPVSIWAASDADVDKTAGGSAASISSCQLGEFLKATPIATYKTACPASNTACGCPSVQNASTPE
jgi:hypothetical protein